MPTTLIDQLREELQELARHLEAHGWLLSRPARGELRAKREDRWFVRAMIRRNGDARVMLYNEEDRLDRDGFSVLLAAQTDEPTALVAFESCEQQVNRWLHDTRMVPMEPRR